MTSRYHWVTGGSSSSGSLPTGLQTVVAHVPAGGIMKRFMLRNTAITGYEATNFSNGLFPFSMTQVVSFTTGANTGREIYRARKIIPIQTMVDPFDLITSYKAQWGAGDHELGFNQKCSYGQPGDPAYDVTMTWALECVPTYTGGVAGEASFQLAVLYYL